MAIAALIATDYSGVGAIKLRSQVYGEPPAKSVNKGDNEDKSDKEKEEQAKDIEDAKKYQAAKNKADADAVKGGAKAATDKAAADQKAKEAAWSKLPNGPDGLQHWPDGRVWYTPDHQIVSGVNVYAQGK